MYDKSARIYDLLYTGTGIKNYPAEAAQLRQLIMESNPVAKTLLDVACGTGAHLAELREWYAVEGADVSPSMLAIARTRLPGVPLHLADMRAIDLGRRFDAVTCLFSSIGYLTDPSELTQTVNRMAAHVAPGGVLIIDGWIRPDEWNDAAQGDPDVATDGKTTVVRLSLSRRVGRITELDMHHLVRTESGIEQFVETHRLALTATEEYVEAVEGAGLAARVIADYMPHRDRVIGIRASGLRQGR